MHVPSWNIKKTFLILWLESCISQNIRSFVKVQFFYFPSLENSHLKYKFLKKVPFSKYKKSCFWENIRKLYFPKYKKFFKLEAGKFLITEKSEIFSEWVFFWKKYKEFLSRKNFEVQGLKVVQVALYVTTAVPFMRKLQVSNS